jgi:hypothetical protein
MIGFDMAGGVSGGGGAAAAAGASAIPSRFDMRFTHVGEMNATIANTEHRAFVGAGVEAGFADMIAAGGLHDVCGAHFWAECCARGFYWISRLLSP